MEIIKTIPVLIREIKGLKRKNNSIGFVPTMGALHEGHIGLIRAARRQNDVVVVSIFVNPAQFGQREDFRKYPRNLKKDAELCAKAGVDIIFFPDAKEIYPSDYRIYVSVFGLSDVLCGKSRPGHFKGVATIVTKLFNIISPDVAYFGQKDAQQAVIIKKVVSDLNIPVKIKILPIYREKDGLALSSRNIYLNPEERKDACVLSEALKLAESLIREGNREPALIKKEMQRLIRRKKTAKIDYIGIVNPRNLEPVEKISAGCLIALAVWIGKTRLIDNIIVRR